MKIQNLNDIQLQVLKKHANIGVARGLSTETIDRDRAVAYGKRVSAFCGYPHTATVIMPGLISAWAAVSVLYLIDKLESLSSSDKAGGDPRHAEWWDLIWDQVPCQKPVFTESIIANALKEIGSVELPYLQGQFSSYYAAWVDCYLELGITVSGYEILSDQVDFGPIFPLRNGFVVISDRLSVCHKGPGGLHNDLGPAFAYRDGLEGYALNGVRVPKHWVMTRPEDLDPHEFPRIQNVEQRREFLRKIGPESLYEKLGGESLEKSDDGVYELVLLDLGGTTGKWPYLKMRNPSELCWHMEEVPRGIVTVADALHWRNNCNLDPEVLT